MLRIHRIQFKREDGILAQSRNTLPPTKGGFFLVVRVSRESVGRCHGIACRRLASGQDIRLSTAKRPCERLCAASYSRPLCRPSLLIGALLHSGPSRLSSRTRNDRFRQPLATFGRHTQKIPRFLLLYIRRQWSFRGSLENGGHNWRDVVDASVIDRVS